MKCYPLSRNVKESEKIVSLFIWINTKSEVTHPPSKLPENQYIFCNPDDKPTNKQVKTSPHLRSNRISYNKPQSQSYETDDKII